MLYFKKTECSVLGKGCTKNVSCQYDDELITKRDTIK